MNAFNKTQFLCLFPSTQNEKKKLFKWSFFHSIFKAIHTLKSYLKVNNTKNCHPNFGKNIAMPHLTPKNENFFPFAVFLFKRIFFCCCVMEKYTKNFPLGTKDIIEPFFFSLSSNVGMGSSGLEISFEIERQSNKNFEFLF